MHLSILFALLIQGAWALQGQDLLAGGTREVKSGAKGLVAVFMSARCPCSNSHVDVVKKLANEYSDFHFVVIHSNSDEPVDEAKTYFKSADLNIPVLQDEHTRLANEFRASRTPHAFVVAPDGKIVYRGGVTDSADAGSARKQFLRDALDDLERGQKIRVAEARSLGCSISR